MLIAGVNCNAQGSLGTNPICRYSGNGKSSATTGRSITAGTSARKKRKVVIARGSLKVKAGRKKRFFMKPTRAGKRILKPGRRVRMRVTIRQRIKGQKTRTMSKTVVVKVKRRG